MYSKERKRKKTKQKNYRKSCTVFNIIFITCYQSLHNLDKKCLITMRYYYDVLLKIWKFAGIAIIGEGKLCCTKAYFTPLSMIKIRIYRSLRALSEEQGEYLKLVSAILVCDMMTGDDEPTWFFDCLLCFFSAIDLIGIVNVGYNFMNN